MSEIGDRLRELAALYDDNPKIACAGAIVTPTEIIVSAFSEFEGDGPRGVATALYYGVHEAPELMDV